MNLFEITLEMEFDRGNEWMLTAEPDRIAEYIETRRRDIQRDQQNIRDVQDTIKRRRVEIKRYQYVLKNQGECMWRFYDMHRADVSDAIKSLMDISRRFKLSPYDLAFDKIDGVTIHVVNYNVAYVFKLLLDAFVWTRCIADGDHAIATRVLRMI